MGKIPYNDLRQVHLVFSRPSTNKGIIECHFRVW